MKSNNKNDFEVKVFWIKKISALKIFTQFLVKKYFIFKSMKPFYMALMHLPWSNRVSFESLYGTWPLFPSSHNAEITFPKAKRPLLILTPSLNRSPVAPVFFARSLPAKSTKWNFAHIMLSLGNKIYVCHNNI